MRNLWRRKVRTVLTISGIVMGVFALTTMGAVAEHFNVLLAGGITYYGGSVQVSDDKASSSYMAVSTIDQIQRVQGVAAVFPSVTELLDPSSTDVINFGVRDYVSNFDRSENRYSAFKLSLAQGGWVTNASRDQVDLGSAVAAEYHERVGDTIDLPVRPSDAKPNCGRALDSGSPDPLQ